MQRLFRDKIANKIGTSATVREISQGMYDKSTLEKHFVVKNKSDVKDYTNDKIMNITYSSNERVSDIVGRVPLQAVLQKYHCSEYGIAVITELFTHYTIDVILKCCGIILYYNHIPILCLVNSAIGGDLILTVDLYNIQKDIDVRCNDVSGLIEQSVHESLISGRVNANNTSNTAIYALTAIFLGFCAVAMVTGLKR